MSTLPAQTPLCMLLSTLQQFTTEVVPELFINAVHQDCMAVMQSADQSLARLLSPCTAMLLLLRFARARVKGHVQVGQSPPQS